MLVFFLLLSVMLVAVTHATVLLATDSSFLRQSAQQWATKMFPSTVKVKVVWYQVRDEQHPCVSMRISFSEFIFILWTIFSSFLLDATCFHRRRLIVTLWRVSGGR